MIHPNDPPPRVKSDDGCAKIGQKTLRRWCEKNGVVLDPLLAADLVAYIASAVRTDRALREPGEREQ